MINPEYGFEKYSAEYVSWHKWVLKMPLGNWLSFTIMLGASFVTFFRDDDATLFIMDGIITGYLLIATVINIIVMGPVKHNDRTDTSAKYLLAKPLYYSKYHLYFRKMYNLGQLYIIDHVFISGSSLFSYCVISNIGFSLTFVEHKQPIVKYIYINNL